MYNEAPIIINEEALTEAFIPTRLLHREGQVQEFERCLRPALKNRSIENIFLIGTSGTGKTIARAIDNRSHRVYSSSILITVRFSNPNQDTFFGQAELTTHALH